MNLVDAHNRIIDYLRISVTDRCNFRCVYCMPESGTTVAPKSELLTRDEILQIARVAVSLGIRKIRLTGGEPLVRKDLGDIIAQLGAFTGITDLSLTTNGFLLSPLAQQFSDDGLTRVNISLDTLRPERFQQLARRGTFATVWEGVQAALRAELHPVKLNCVVMRGYNADEIADFAALTLQYPLHVRFIELMPVNWSQGDDTITKSPTPSRDSTKITLYANTADPTFNRIDTKIGDTGNQLDAIQMHRAFVPMAEMQQQIEQRFGTLQPAKITTNGPARNFRLPDSCGTIGFISQITRDQCLTCNRLRLTSDGFLRPCLMADGEIPLRDILRSGGTESDIADAFRLAVYHKPLEHRIEDGFVPMGRNMNHLGG